MYGRPEAEDRRQEAGGRKRNEGIFSVKIIDIESFTNRFLDYTVHHNNAFLYLIKVYFFLLITLWCSAPIVICFMAYYKYFGMMHLTNELILFNIGRAA